MNAYKSNNSNLPNSMSRLLRRLSNPRNGLFALLCILSVIVYWEPLKSLFMLASRTDEYSHTIVIPILTVALIISERAKIFRNVRYSLRIGLGVIAAAVFIGILWGANAPVGNQNSAFALEVFSLVLVWIGIFILCYGRAAFQSGIFGLLFLLLTVPIPEFLLGKVIYSVRYGSAEIVSLLLGLANVPAFREGFHFVFPTVSIEIAKECSGIHSTMALLIVTLLAGHLFLRSKLARTVLVLSAIPIVCITNGIRITSLTLLAIYVNRGFLSGRLHHEGGFLFFGLALVIMAGLLYLFGSRRKKQPAESPPPSSLPVTD